MQIQDPEEFERRALAEDAPPPSGKKQTKKTQPGAEGAEEDDDFVTVGEKGRTITISSEGVFKALAQVLEARGRKVSKF